MSRLLRGWLLGSIAIAFLYLLVHAREPLRLNLGDPVSEANALISIHHVQSDGLLAIGFRDIGAGTAAAYRDLREPPLPELVYGAIGKVSGARDIAAFRFVALLFSALAMWLWFSYVRRLYTDRTAWIATALFSTSLLWMMYADSIHQAPVMHCAGFLSLWGLVRAIETQQRRHYAAALVGAFACLLTSYDDWIFLPAAMLFTISLKAGRPLARANRHLVVWCAVGCLLGIVTRYLCVIGTSGWQELGALSSLGHGSWFALPTLVRRITLVLTPMFWITATFHVVKTLRAPSVSAALKDSPAWMLLAAVAFWYLFPQRAASQMLAVQVALPFYAIGSAVLLDRMLESHLPLRWLAQAWLVAAPLWSFYFMVTHPRSVLRPDDVAKANAYLAANDRNDFVLSNLASDAPIVLAFERHRWAALDAKDPSGAPREMLRMFERTGAASVHEVIFTGPDSRFVDSSLWPLGMPRGLWAITGAPHMHRAKAKRVIAEHDTAVLANLKAVRATKVLQLSNYTIYRIDRSVVMEIAGELVPAARHIDFGSVNAWQHELLGWSGPMLLPDGTPASRVEPTEHCSVAPCQTVQTERGLRVMGEASPQLGQLMLRMDRVCDQRLTFMFAHPSYVQLSIGELSTASLPGTSATFTIAARYLTKGVNVVALENLLPAASGVRLEVTALDIAPTCVDDK